MLRFVLCHFASTRVNLILDQDELVMGEEATGKVIVRGSGKDHKINGITVRRRLFANGNWYSRYVSDIPIIGEFELKAGEEKEFPFSFECPAEIPFSHRDPDMQVDTTWYRFETGMDVEQAVNPLDKDRVVVRPSKMVRHFLEAMEQMGYRLTNTTVQSDSLRNFENEKQHLWFTGPDVAQLRMDWCPKELPLQKISEPFTGRKEQTPSRPTSWTPTKRQEPIASTGKSWRRGKRRWKRSAVSSNGTNLGCRHKAKDG